MAPVCITTPTMCKPFNRHCTAFLVALLLIVLGTLATGSEAAPSLNYNAKQTWCGATITQTLSMFCKGRYLSMMDIVIKRAQNEENGYTYAEEEAEAGVVPANDDLRNYQSEAIELEKHRLEHSFSADSLLEQLRAQASAESARRVRMAAAAASASAIAAGMRPRRASEQLYVYRGIADECCQQPCSVTTLLSYCRTPPKY